MSAALLDTWTIGSMPRSCAARSTLAVPRGLTSRISCGAPRVQRVDVRGVQDGVAALERPLDRADVGHVAHDVVDVVEPVRRQRGRDPRGRANEQPHVVARVDERLDRVRAEEARCRP